MNLAAQIRCCKDFADAMQLREPPVVRSFFFNENRVLYLTVGRVETEEGPA